MILSEAAREKGFQCDSYRKVQVNYKDVKPEEYDTFEVHDGDIIRLVIPNQIPVQFIIGEED